MPIEEGSLIRQRDAQRSKLDKAKVLSECNALRFAPGEFTQSTIPSLARDSAALSKIATVLPSLPTRHEIWEADARQMDFIADKSVHLVVTSPPYWTLKKYNDHESQMGDIQRYEEFLHELDRVLSHCYRVLVPGGRVVCVVGDVCLSRRKNKGRHTVVPLHASIQEHCRAIGFDNLAPIIWYKIANASLEASGNGSGFLGKPYEPNAVIKNDIEFILMERKPGGYRSPSLVERIYSVIPEEQHKEWFRQIWSGLPGASTRKHPAPFPVELASRLIRMFSFVGDTVLDPFVGSGTTSIAAWRTGRNSVGIDVEPGYVKYASSRFQKETGTLTSRHTFEVRGKQEQCP